jgi:hypothetical protein
MTADGVVDREERGACSECSFEVVIPGRVASGATVILSISRCLVVKHSQSLVSTMRLRLQLRNDVILFLRRWAGEPYGTQAVSQGVSRPFDVPQLSMNWAAEPFLALLILNSFISNT